MPGGEGEGEDHDTTCSIVRGFVGGWEVGVDTLVS
jgi:hypothetical protein